MPDRLFVYGTLRRDVWNSRVDLLGSAARFVGRARMQGRLYHLGRYPGLVPSRDPGSWVYGEVYALEHLADTLARLDRYEGCGLRDPAPWEFERVEADVVLAWAARDRGWVYVYAGPVDEARRIRSGDYRAASVSQGRRPVPRRPRTAARRAETLAADTQGVEVGTCLPPAR